MDNLTHIVDTLMDEQNWKRQNPALFMEVACCCLSIGLFYSAASLIEIISSNPGVDVSLQEEIDVFHKDFEKAVLEEKRGWDSFTDGLVWLLIQGESQKRKLNKA